MTLSIMYYYSFLSRAVVVYWLDMWILKQWIRIETPIWTLASEITFTICRHLNGEEKHGMVWNIVKEKGEIKIHSHINFKRV